MHTTKVTSQNIDLKLSYWSRQSNIFMVNK